MKKINGLTAVQTRVLREVAASKNGFYMVESYKPRWTLQAMGLIHAVRGTDRFTLTTAGKELLETVDKAAAAKGTT